MTESLPLTTGIWDRLAWLSDRCEVSFFSEGNTAGRRVWHVRICTREAEPRVINVRAGTLWEAVIQAIDEAAGIESA
jgi:hypothetical protein